MKRLLFFIFILFTSQTILKSQATDIDYKRIRIGEAKHIVSGLALSPDIETLAISPVQSFPFYLFDWKNQEVLKTFNVGNWYAGSSISYSAKGKYLLLNQFYYIDFESGKMLYRFQQSFRLFEKNEGGMIAADSRSSFVFLPDGRSILMTMGNHLIKWNFEPKE